METTVLEQQYKIIRIERKWGYLVRCKVKKKKKRSHQHRHRKQYNLNSYIKFCTVNTKQDIYTHNLKHDFAYFYA